MNLGITLNLGPGNYEVRLAVLDRKTNADILYHHFANIVIRDDPRYGGIAYMNPTLVGFDVGNVGMGEATICESRT